MKVPSKASRHCKTSKQSTEIERHDRVRNLTRCRLAANSAGCKMEDQIICIKFCVKITSSDPKCLKCCKRPSAMLSWAEPKFSNGTDDLITDARTPPTMLALG